MSSGPDPLPVTSASHRAITIMASATVLALLYFGREVLIPITLAFILSLLMAPLIRGLRRIGLGHAPSVLIAVLALALFLVGLATVIGSQVVHLGGSLPQYEATIHSKVQTVRAMTVGRMEAMQGEAGRVMRQLEDRDTGVPAAPANPQRGVASPTSATPAEVHASSAEPMAVITRILSSIWVPLQTTGIVLVVLVFVLLEHESLRDRFIRLAGGTDLRATTTAINDAGERLSRFFVSQFSVNFGVGVVIWAGLAIIGVPDAPLWGALTAVLRFVPYVGVWLAAMLATLLAAAVGPGWSLMLMTLGLYAVVETITSQLVEPQLYGHTTGLSPLAVVVAAIFWSWLWGPVGLIVSTPLTLCLVVAGRHVKALNLLDILLGDTPALTMPQRLYQRALSGDSDEIIAGARIFLKRKSFAAYCDAVLLPALQLARIDLAQGAISPEQQVKARGAIVRVLEALSGEAHQRSRWHRHASVLDDPNLGRLLRQQREAVSGRWQGPLAVAPGSVVLCVGLGSNSDDLATEILARVLRDLSIDGRHLSIEDIEAFEAEPPPDATPNGVSMLYIVSAAASKERERGDSVAMEMRRRFPEACLVAVVLPELLAASEPVAVSPEVNLVASSFEEAAQHAIARFPGDNPGARRST
ncbi:AI-2E family transporter [Rhodanobacter koreensis]